MSESIYLKYRPKNFKHVFGQDAAVAALKNVLAKKSAHAFLFVGPSGTGKTTLARIVAAKLGANADDIREIDAATNTGIDDMRRVAETLLYRPLGGGAAKVLIVDECHALSKAAWQSMLKVLEEPPEWAYWCLCTTEGSKVPETIKTRCATIQLHPIGRSDLQSYLSYVAEEENILGGEAGEKVIDLCVSHANGSMRQALMNLALCASVSTRTEAAKLLQSAEESSEAIELARALLSNAPWSQLCEIMGRMKEQNPESVRHVVRAYMTTVALGAKDKAAPRALNILDAFSTPANPHDGLSPVVLAAGRVIFGG